MNGIEFSHEYPQSNRLVIAITSHQTTAAGVEIARAELEAAGHEVVVFHANGTGGRTMEQLILSRRIAAVLDFTTTELAAEQIGSGRGAGPDRLTAAAITGVPQVVVPGALDHVAFAQEEARIAAYSQRSFQRLADSTLAMRTTADELDRLGKEIAEKASAAHGLTAIFLPRRGFSELDRPGTNFWSSEADAALIQSIQNWIAPFVEVVEFDLHVNDAAFARACAVRVLEMLKR